MLSPQKKAFDGSVTQYIANARLILYTEAMLRIDPCLTVVVVRPDNRTKTRDSVAEALRAAGAPADDAAVSRFITDYTADVDALKRKFPNRVAV